MFVIVYQPTTAKIKSVTKNNETRFIGQWLVDTDENGCLVSIDDLETALNRTQHIRKIGGEACLLTIIE